MGSTVLGLPIKTLVGDPTYGSPFLSIQGLDWNSATKAATSASATFTVNLGSLLIPAPPTPPPSQVEVTITVAAEHLQMDWTAPVTPVASFNVQYSTDNVNWITPNDSPILGSLTQYIFQGTSAVNTYYARIQSVDSQGNASVWVLAGPWTVGAEVG